MYVSVNQPYLDRRSVLMHSQIRIIMPEWFYRASMISRT
jgi:hypothetical protein